MTIKSDYVTPLLDGESRISHAPSVMLDNGKLCVPQQYLTYQHTRRSVEKLIIDIEYDSRYILFVGEDVNSQKHSSLYLQVGIIGVDNYKKSSHKKNSKKLVYGRKWRIEPELPTSEIIQTAFLALKKAREHEVRELFCFKKNGKSTPFNTHHDLPLIAQNAELITFEDLDFPDELQIINIKKSLNFIRYDHALFKCIRLENIGSQWLVQLKVFAFEETTLPEIKSLDKAPLSFVLQRLCTNEFYHQLMDSLINLSNRHVDENFQYKQVARFSRSIDVEKMAKLSSKVRKLNASEHQLFSKKFVDTNYEVDQTRVPSLTGSELSIKIRKKIESFGHLDGILP